VKERPILFSGPMIRALLAGTKTQTRRVLREQPMLFVGGEGVTDEGGTPVPRQPAIINLYGNVKVQSCPYGAPGDRLWVRETWVPDPVYENEQRVCYRATAADEACDKWKSPLFMPRWASRITLEVTNVRVQRLQDISEEDASSEGVATGEQVSARLVVTGLDGKTTTSKGTVVDFTHRGAFCRLWDSINGDRAPWASNPWVWAISFRRVQP